MQTQYNSEPRMYSIAEAASRLGCSPSLLNKLRLYQTSDSPPFIKAGRRVLYPVGAFQSWIESKSVGGKRR